jgi:asparagine synthase (glutamine-hydrolysing)
MASGGVDSSLLWLAAGGGIDRAFTIRWAGHAGEGLGEDTAAVRQLSASVGTPVSFVEGVDADPLVVLPSGDLFADPAVDLCRRISADAYAQGYKVLLSGQGGDELFGGYRRQLLGPRAAGRHLPGAAHAAALLTRAAVGGVRGEYGARLLRAYGTRDPLAAYMTLCTYSGAADRAAILDCTEAEVGDDVVWASHREVFDRTPPSWSLFRRLRAVDLAVYLPGLGLAYADRAGMHESVEVRVPLLDLELVRFAQRLPDRLLVRGLHGKVLLKAVARELLPSSIVDRPKRGFGVPVSQLPTTTVPSSRGFRQARYLATAATVLERWRQSNCV